MGKSVVINLQTRVKRVLLSDPTVIDALVLNPNQIVVEAKAPGVSSLILWDEFGAARMFDATVDLDRRVSRRHVLFQETYTFIFVKSEIHVIESFAEVGWI